MALENGRQLPASTVAKKAHLSIATISGTVSRLVENGLIERMQSIEDKRICLLNLTEQGRSILKSVPSPLPENFSNKFENNIPEWEKNMILSSLQKVIYLMQNSE
jgi:DNA-binding MarR family transcriptional regulator